MIIKNNKNGQEIADNKTFLLLNFVYMIIPVNKNCVVVVVVGRGVEAEMSSGFNTC